MATVYDHFSEGFFVLLKHLYSGGKNVGKGAIKISNIIDIPYNEPEKLTFLKIVLVKRKVTLKKNLKNGRAWLGIIVEA